MVRLYPSIFVDAIVSISRRISPDASLASPTRYARNTEKGNKYAADTIQVIIIDVQITVRMETFLHFCQHHIRDFTLKSQIANIHV